MCGALVCDSGSDDDEDSKTKDECYIPKPFPKDQFKPLEQTHILETLDVFTNEAKQIKFCDEEGHEIKFTSLNIIKFHYPPEPKVVQTAYHRLEDTLVWDKSLSLKEIKSG